MIRLASGCKINLGLRVRGLRPDGLHEIQSVFYPLRHPADHIFVQPGPQKGLAIDVRGAPCQIENNILAKTWQLYGHATGFLPALKILLVKRAPIGAGLGGGSANAAALLQHLNSIAPLPLAPGELNALAARIGSDVPFFLHSTPCLVTGHGEKIKPLKFKGHGLYLLLIWPGMRLGAGEVFSHWDKLAQAQIGLTNSLRKANDLASVLVDAHKIDLANDLECAAYSLMPGLRPLKRLLLSYGALKAAMSGSGSAHYGIFDNASASKAALAGLQKKGMRAYWQPMLNFGA